ncbi:hypothetical protein SLA2020_456940 [Shorea laevis]
MIRSKSKAREVCAAAVVCVSDKDSVKEKKGPARVGWRRGKEVRCKAELITRSVMEMKEERRRVAAEDGRAVGG